MKRQAIMCRCAAQCIVHSGGCGYGRCGGYCVPGRIVGNYIERSVWGSLPDLLAPPPPASSRRARRNSPAPARSPMLRGIFSKGPSVDRERRGTAREERAARALQRRFRIKARVVFVFKAQAAFSAVQREAAMLLLLKEKMYIAELHSCLDLASRAVRPSVISPAASGRLASADSSSAAESSPRSLDASISRSTPGGVGGGARPPTPHLSVEQARALFGRLPGLLEAHQRLASSLSDFAELGGGTVTRAGP
eukprot:scaffold7979_cov129-Isochrysis_galbana.AAC.5